jgi:hypothetical protein
VRGRSVHIQSFTKHLNLSKRDCYLHFQSKSLPAHCFELLIDFLWQFKVGNKTDSVKCRFDYKYTLVRSGTDGKQSSSLPKPQAQRTHIPVYDSIHRATAGLPTFRMD